MSNYKKDYADRRDFRSAKPIEEEMPKSSVRKNTKQWCKGKAGKEHNSVCMTYDEINPNGRMFGDDKDGKRIFKQIYSKRRVLVCTSCGKELAIYYGFKNEKKPDWVNK